MTPTCRAPTSVQWNSQFLRLWKALQKWSYVRSRIMCTYVAGRGARTGAGASRFINSPALADA
jgi:hypothetical protein